MKIKIDRKWKKETYTIGNLYIDGVWFCNTLEDRDRGLKQTDSLASIKQRKIYGETAIPTGIYTLSLDTLSPKYSKIPFYQEVCKGFVPRILNVPGFEGILIHCLNDPSQTFGCIGVGLNTQKGRITQSKVYFKKLYGFLKKAKDKNEKVEIEII